MAGKENQLDSRAQTRQQTQPPSSDSEPAPPSMASRIRSSASGLVSSAVAGSSTGAGAGHDASATLAASLAEKDGGSSQQPPTTFNRPTGSSRAGGVVGDTFRSPGAQSDDTDWPLQFDGKSTVTDPSSHGAHRAPGGQVQNESGYLDGDRLQMATGAGPAESSFPSFTPDDATAFDRAWESRSARPPSFSNSQLLESDGQAVVSHLSDPSFEPSSYIHDEDNDDIITEPNPYIPTAQPSQPPASLPDDVSPLTLVPGLNQAETSSATSTTRTQDQNQDRDLSTLSSLVSPSDAPWLSLDALYHDAVYGNVLEPYVAAAEKEVAEYQPSEEDEEEETRLKALREGTAVKRLQLMLGHVRGESENSGKKEQEKE